MFNAAGVTLRGEMLAVPHRAGAHYFYAGSGRPLHWRVYGGKDYLTMKLDPQSVTCILQTAPAPPPPPSP